MRLRGNKFSLFNNVALDHCLSSITKEKIPCLGVGCKESEWEEMKQIEELNSNQLISCTAGLRDVQPAVYFAETLSTSWSLSCFNRGSNHLCSFLCGLRASMVPNTPFPAHRKTNNEVNLEATSLKRPSQNCESLLCLVILTSIHSSPQPADVALRTGKTTREQASSG